MIPRRVRNGRQDEIDEDQTRKATTRDVAAPHIEHQGDDERRPGDRGAGRTFMTNHNTPATTAAMTTSHPRTMNTIIPDIPHIMSMLASCSASAEPLITEHAACQRLLDCGDPGGRPLGSPSHPFGSRAG